MLGHVGLDDLSNRGAVRTGRQPPRRERVAGREVDQRFQQAPHAPVALRRPHHHRHHGRIRQHAAQVGLNLFGLGNLVLEQAFQERVVEVRQALE